MERFRVNSAFSKKDDVIRKGIKFSVCIPQTIKAVSVLFGCAALHTHNHFVSKKYIYVKARQKHEVAQHHLGYHGISVFHYVHLCQGVNMHVHSASPEKLFGYEYRKMSLKCQKNSGDKRVQL